jgi:hypothetical protein
MLKFEMPAGAARVIESKFELLVRESKARKLRKEVVHKKHDGGALVQDGEPGIYTKSFIWQPYTVHVKATQSHPEGDVSVKFCYDDRPERNPERKHIMVSRGFVRISELGIMVLADTILAGGLLQMLGMSLTDEEGNIDTERLTKVISAAIKYVDGEEPSDIKLIIDKE